MAAIAITLLLTWVFGSTITRALGVALIFYSLFDLSQNGNSLGSYQLLGTGIVIWLAGHWLWAFKHKNWRSQLALNIYSLPILDSVAPIPSSRRADKNRHDAN